MMGRIKHILEATEELLTGLTEINGTDPELAAYVHRTLNELEDYELVARRKSYWRA
jgi:hypothetical protein